MRNLLMKVNYDGTNYDGFQTQPQGNTIQDRLEQAILHLTGEELKITASGRTDAGVHAYGQPFNFTTSSRIPLERWCLALNARLPQDIVVTEARKYRCRFTLVEELSVKLTDTRLTATGFQIRFSGAGSFTIR